MSAPSLGERLLAAVRAEHATLAELLHLSEDLTSAVLHRCPQDVARAAAEQRATVERLRERQTARAAEVASAARLLGVPGAPLRRLVDVLSASGAGAQAAELEAAWGRLAEVQRAVRAAVARNALLLRQALALTAFARRRLLGAAGAGLGYAPAPAARLLDRRA